MLQDLALALRLQALDRKIASLEDEIATLPKHIAEIEKKLESTRDACEADLPHWPLIRAIAKNSKAISRCTMRKSRS